MSGRIPDPPDNQLTHAVIGAAIEVHRHLGPGLLESIYEDCLCHELQLRRIAYRRQFPVSITYKGMSPSGSLRLDIMVEDRLVLEIKSVERLEAIHEQQLLTYLRLTSCELGLLLNFNSGSLKGGLRRVRNFRSGDREAAETA